MDTKSLNLGRKVLVDVVHSLVGEAERLTEDHVPPVMLHRTTKTDLEGNFELIGLGRDYARVQIFPIGLRMYKLPDEADFKHPQVQRIMFDVRFLRQHGIHIYEHGHIPSANLYCVFTNEQGV